MPQLSIADMKKLIGRLEEAQELEEEIPQSYISRLERGAELLGQLRRLPAVNWDEMKSVDDIERAEAAIHQKLELKNEIEKHLHTCGLTVVPKTRAAHAAAAERQRAPRRSREQVEYDLAVAEVTRQKKKDLNLPARGRITAEDQARLDKEVEKELKKQKIHPPQE